MRTIRRSGPPEGGRQAGRGPRASGSPPGWLVPSAARARSPLVGSGLSVGGPGAGSRAPSRGGGCSRTQGVSAFPNADAHHLSSVRNHPLSCMLCSAVCCVCVRVWRLVGRMPWAARRSPWAWPRAGACTRPRNKLKVPVETGGSGVHCTGPGGAYSKHMSLPQAFPWVD